MDRNIITASSARTNLYKLIDEVSLSHHPKTITGKRNNAVLMSEDDWMDIKETLYMSSIPNMIESIKEGMDTPLSDCEEKVDWA
jgi:antitoxin YefM